MFIFHTEGPPESFLLYDLIQQRRKSFPANSISILMGDQKTTLRQFKKQSHKLFHLRAAKQKMKKKNAGQMKCMYLKGMTSGLKENSEYKW